MLDLETLGTRHTSAIIQIGACYFDRETGEIGETFSTNIDYVVSTYPFTTDEATIKWWNEQSKEAKDSLISSLVSIKDAIMGLSKFLDRNGVCIWSHATFDIPILLNAFEVMELKFPIHYRGHRDIRTLMDIAKHRGDPTTREGIHHNALDDCIFQVKYCVEALQKIKI